MKRYLVIGGNVISKNDGDEHYISARRLVDLYRVDIAECVLVDDGRIETVRGLNTHGLITLTPRYDGNYTLEG